MELQCSQSSEFIKNKFNEAPLIDFILQVCALRKLSQPEAKRSTGDFFVWTLMVLLLTTLIRE